VERTGKVLNIAATKVVAIRLTPDDNSDRKHWTRMHKIPDEANPAFDGRSLP
jgi:hypothetical protein